MSLALRVGDHLSRLYPNLADAERVAVADRLIDAFGATAAAVTVSGPKFRDDEVVLITYGDTFVAAGQPHLRSLGEFWQRHLAPFFSTLHVLPLFPSSSDGGFSIVDYRSVDPALGDWDDLAAVGADEVMVDLVCNHGSAQSKWFADFVADRLPGRDFFTTASPDADLSMVTRPRTHPLLRRVETAAGVRHAWATFSHDQIDFDFTNPDVLVEFCSILGNYMSHGATRIRLDAIAYLWKEIGTSCVHLPETHEVVKLMRTLVEARDPQVLLITETNVPHDRNVSYFGRSIGDTTDEAHVVYNFTLAPLIIWSVIAEHGNALTDWLGQLEPAPPGGAFLNFLASHDGIGLRPIEDLVTAAELEPLIEGATAVGGAVSSYSTPSGPRPYELNVSLADLLAGPTGETAPRYLLAHALMLAVQGIPALYVHSMLVSPGDSAAVDESGHNRDINRASIGLHEAHDRVTTGWRGAVFDQMTHLIAVRRRTAAFGADSAQLVHRLHDHVVAIERSHADGSSVLALHNMSSTAIELTIPEAFQTSTDLLTDQTIATTTARLQPWQAMWLVGR